MDETIGHRWLIQPPRFTGDKCDLCLALICISLVSEVEHLFIYLTAVCIYFFWSLSISFVLYSICLLVLLMWAYELYIRLSFYNMSNTKFFPQLFFLWLCLCFELKFYIPLLLNAEGFLTYLWCSERVANFYHLALLRFHLIPWKVPE